ncbi:sulfatase-like hydrolase/transferase [Mesorhizobium marinum]|uniref:Sulfatase/phosphatase domain-containing protein n=1 Tax=Mesorhizobium marinum TaxID=3228790 RepID=A0ABV3R5R5_9HYPH
MPDADNTLIFYIVGDNGASSEGGFDGTINEVMNLNGFPTDLHTVVERLDKVGGPDTEPHYPLEWAWAGNSPFQWVKQVASHLGGTRNPMVVSWPGHIKDPGGIRGQFTHLIDVLPTMLEAAHLPAPKVVDGIEQKPMDGASFLSVVNDAGAGEVRTRQYFEVFSNRSMYDNGWKANAQHTLPWRQDVAPGNWDSDKWELYNLKEDYSEAKDLAAEMPDKLAELKALFKEEAEKYHVYPLDDRGAQRLAIPKPTPSDPNRTHFVFYPGAVRLAETAAPNTKNKSHTITADIVVPDGGSEGVIVAEGGSSAGFALFMREGKLVYHYNWFDEERTEVVSEKALPAGEVKVKMEFAYDGQKDELGKGGTATLFVNDEKVGSAMIEKTVPGRFGIDTFGVGEDTGSPVVNTYSPPYRFTGEIKAVEIDLQ